MTNRERAMQIVQWLRSDKRGMLIEDYVYTQLENMIIQVQIESVMEALQDSSLIEKILKPKDK